MGTPEQEFQKLLNDTEPIERCELEPQLRDKSIDISDAPLIPFDSPFPEGLVPVKYTTGEGHIITYSHIPSVLEWASKHADLKAVALLLDMAYAEEIEAYVDCLPDIPEDPLS